MTTYVHGHSLDCALGPTLALRQQNLAKHKAPLGYSCQYDGQHITLPYFTAFDRNQFKVEADALKLIEDHIFAALDAAGWPHEDLHTLPIFIGSTAYTLFAEEENLRSVSAGDLNDAAYRQNYTLNAVAAFFKTRYNNPQVFTFGSACTSSINSLLYAQSCIDMGLAERAIIVGFELSSLITLYGFKALELFASGAYCPFAHEANGLVLGEGIAVMAIGNQAPQGTKITLDGGTSGCDPYSVVTTQQDGAHILKVMTEALARANIDVAALRAVKAHATGSPINDLAEFHALDTLCPTTPIILLKPYVGHTLGACGIIECVLLIEQLRIGELPDLPEPYQTTALLSTHVLTKKTVLHTGYYLLNYLGFGGNNASLVVGLHQ